MKITELNFPEYKKVIKAEDPKSGLKAYIAIYSTRLGPSLGGVRMWPYPGEDAAIQDVLLLSKAMAYKAAATGIPLGGGKGVIWGDPHKDKSPELFQAFGKAVESLKGQYITTEDAGIRTKDLEIIATETSHVTGLQKGSGDPSPATAKGVFYGIQEAVKFKLNKKSLKGLKIIVQGMGHVGLELIGHLAKTGAKLMVTDIESDRLEEAKKRCSVEVISPDEIFKIPCDVFAPCALGQVISGKDVDSLRFSIISGASNNQLLDEEATPPLLHQKGILHSPGFVINAGGLINIYVIDIQKKNNVDEWLQKIPVSLRKIFERSQKENIPPFFVANEMAEERLRKGSTT